MISMMPRLTIMTPMAAKRSIITLDKAREPADPNRHALEWPEKMNTMPTMARY